MVWTLQAPQALSSLAREKEHLSRQASAQTGVLPQAVQKTDISPSRLEAQVMHAFTVCAAKSRARPCTAGPSADTC